MSEYRAPVVPQELSSGLTDDVLAIHERYASYGFDDYSSLVKNVTPSMIPSNEHTSNQIVIGNPTDPFAPMHVLALPHQQAWKPSMAIRSHLYHEINNPDGLTLVLPNNSIHNRAYRFSDAELAAIAAGSMRPFFEHQTRAAEYVANLFGMQGKVALAGYSLGGLTALGIASVGSDRLNVAEVHSVESPNEEQTAKELKKKFLKSADILGKEQRAAIHDAALPILDEALRADKLALDYVRFGIASLLNAENKALSKGMAHSEYEELVRRTLAQYDSAVIYAGHIAGSLLFAPEVVADINDPRFIVRSIGEGVGSHRHPTGDNPIAHAIMMRAA